MFSYALGNGVGRISVVLVNENDPEKAAQTEVTVNLLGTRPDTNDRDDRAQLRGRGQAL